MNPQNSLAAQPGSSPSAHSAQEVGRALKSAASDCASGLKAGAARVTQARKDAAVERIDGLGQSIDETARALEEKDPNIAWFAHRAAERVQRVADYLRERDFASLREDCSDLARRHPAAFFGGLFVAGLVVGNMLKATARGAASSGLRQGSEHDGEDYPSQARGPVAEGGLYDPSPAPSAAAL